MTRNRRNTVLGVSAVDVMVGMLGMSFAAVPLYRLFCAVTGYGGTPNDRRWPPRPGSIGRDDPGALQRRYQSGAAVEIRAGPDARCR